MEVYGHNQINLFFVPLIKVHKEGFIFNNREYSWGDVREVSVYDPFPNLGGLFGTGTMPRATIVLSDGKKIKILARIFVKKGTKAKVGFWSCKSDTFDEFITLFRSKKAGAQGTSISI